MNRGRAPPAVAGFSPPWPGPAEAIAGGRKSMRQATRSLWSKR